MKENSTGASTQELWARLFRAATADCFLAENGSAAELPAFSDYITEICEAKGEKPERVIKRGDIESSYGHRLFAGGRSPSRDTVLKLAFGLELDTDGTQQLLKVARKAELHPRVKRDAVVAFYLHRHKSVTDLQQALLENRLPLLGGGKNGE
ncbi:MAG: hypothetical protein IJG63_00910 [Oscillospiraceae bacterium]|nr:hypothetical protein [Oscillospiraceae bacterium]